MENKEQKTRVHIVAPYLINPQHPITVALVGAGGSGSQMLSALARIHTSLRALGGQGLHVTVYDPDEVSEANIGRQLFLPTDVGLNKAVCLVSRFNRCYLTGWDAEDRCFTENVSERYNIVISCTDNVKSRLEIDRYMRHPNLGCNERTSFYWLDLGNGQRTGQVILGSIKIKQEESKQWEPVEHLPFVTEEFDLTKVDERDSGPSCSLAEALTKQDLFINSSLAQLAGSLLWAMLHDGIIDYRGFYLNLENYKMTGLPV